MSRSAQSKEKEPILQVQCFAMLTNLLFNTQRQFIAMIQRLYLLDQQIQQISILNALDKQT